MIRLGTALRLGIIGLACSVAFAPGAEGKESPGQALFLKYRCKACHTISALGIEKKSEPAEEGEKPEAGAKKKPPDLSGVGLEHKADWLERWLLKKEMKEGKTHRKKFRGTDAEAKTLALWLETLKTEPAAKDKAK